MTGSREIDPREESKGVAASKGPPSPTLEEARTPRAGALRHTVRASSQPGAATAPPGESEPRKSQTVSGVWERHEAPVSPSGPPAGGLSTPAHAPTIAPAPRVGSASAGTAGSLSPGGTAVRSQEHRANLGRWRRAFRFGTILWVAFIVVDWAMDTLLYPGTFGYLVATRMAIVPWLLFIIWRTRRDPPVGPRTLRAFDLLGFGAASASIAFMSLRVGGLESLYPMGVIVAIIARATFVVEPWQRGVVGYGFMILSWAAVVLSGGLWDPVIAAQLHDPRSLATFVITAGFVVGAALMTLLGNHAFWSLQRQVFASRTIGRYRLRRKLGEGGMGEVWAAWHAALRREVAVKLLRVDEGQDPTLIERFEREVAALSELSHPNTIRVFDYGVTEDGIWYYVMELLEGEDVRRLVEREGPLPEERAVHITEQAARALAEAHARGIVHRDIKPENLFLTRAGGERDVVKVFDFGIAKRTAAQDDHTLTRTGAVMGTPAYMSPEAACGEEADARSDVYSLGATLYYMLAARPPFDRDGVVDLLLDHIHSDVPPLAETRGAAVSPALEAVVMRSLAKNPADRYAGAQELAAALQACAPAGSQAARRAAEPTASGPSS